MPFLSLLAWGVAVIISYLAGSVLLSPFTHNAITIGNVPGSLFYFLLLGIIFAAFTYGVVMIEKSKRYFLFDHFRHMVLFYVLLIIIVFHEHATLYQAFLPAIDTADANNDELVTAIHTAKRMLTVLGTFVVVIISNLIVLYLVKKPKK